MKKILILCLLLITTLYCVALERPRWVSSPISVYIQPYGNMSVLMKQAFLAWEKQSKSLVRFKFTNNSEQANIVVDFVDFVSQCSSPDAVGCTEMATRGGQYYKAYVTIGTKEYVRSTKGGYSRTVVERPKNHIYGVMLHEAGHAIGLDHSQNSGSIMYPYDLESMQYLTKEDMRLLYNKYH